MDEKRARNDLGDLINKHKEYTILLDRIRSVLGVKSCVVWEEITHFAYERPRDHWSLIYKDEEYGEIITASDLFEQATSMGCVMLVRRPKYMMAVRAWICLMDLIKKELLDNV